VVLIFFDLSEGLKAFIGRARARYHDVISESYSRKDLKDSQGTLARESLLEEAI